MKAKQKWKGNTGGGRFGQTLLIFLFKILDIRVGYALMALAVPFYMLRNPRGCRAIYNYFRRQFNFPEWKALWWTYKNHFAFGQAVLDRFAVFSGRKDMFRVEIIGNEHFTRLTDGPKGFILASSHTGNFEIGGYLLHQEKKPINAIIFPGEAPVVQRNRSRILEENHIRLVPVSGDMSHIFAIHQALRDGEIVSMPCDRHLGSVKSVKCPLLNGVASFPVGAFALAETLGVEILSIFVIKQSSREYTVYVKPISVPDTEAGRCKQSRIEAHTRAFAGEISNILRKHPCQWFNFYEFWP